jgi:hypothetical protein
MFEWFTSANRSSITHEDSNTINLEEIADNVDFKRIGSGMTTVTGNVGQLVHLTIGGSSHLAIGGDIGHGCKIFKEGSGTLTILGTVADDLQLTVYGQGNVIFTQHPPEKVISSIKKRTGTAEILCAGHPIAQPSQGYRRHNLGIPSTEQQVTEQRVSTLPQPSINRPQVKISPLETTEDKYNPLTQDYIDYCHMRKFEIIADRIKRLNLTPEEEPLFESFIECIMFSYFNDIPVMYDEKYYNLSTLLHLYENNKPDPFSRKPIKLAGIASARIIYDNLDNAIDELHTKRAATKQTLADTDEDHPNLSI